MITIRPGSHAYELLLLLANVGEFPIASLDLLGSARTWKALINKLTKSQWFFFPDSGKKIQCILLNVTGKGKYKTVRLYKGGLPALKLLNEDAYDYYMEYSSNHQMAGDQAHIERNHRVAEAAVMCRNAGIEIRPYMLPQLQADRIYRRSFTGPTFYNGRDLKKLKQDEMNKTMYSRMVGAIFSPGGGYVVYNTRNALMKWHGTGEFKALMDVLEISRLNTDLEDFRSAVLFGRDYQIALRTLEDISKSRRMDMRFDATYPFIHFIPMSSFGCDMLRILTLPDWKRNLLESLFESEELSNDRGSFEYDALVDGTYILCHFDGDITRLMRFRGAIKDRPGRYEVLCYPEQVAFLRTYLGENVSLKVLTMDEIKAFFDD